MTKLPVTGFAVRVQVKSKDDCEGPIVASRVEGEEQLAAIRAALSSSEPPDLPWLAVRGENIVAADIVERRIESRFTYPRRP